MINLSLVIPCYNESANLPLLLERCGQVINRDDVEVVLVDNGSTDDTGEVLEKLLPGYPFVRSTRVEVNQGYGFGILSGLKEARGKILAWTHADMQTDPGDALRGLEIFEQSPMADQLFVKGKRYGRPLSDVIFTVGMSLFESCLLLQRTWDINAQPTMFSRTFFESWHNPPHDFSLDLYVYYQARRMNLKVERSKVYFGKRAHGTSHWNVNWKEKYKFIRRTVEYSLKFRRELSEKV